MVAAVIILVRWCIPDMSSKLKDKIRREAFITNEIIIQHEAQRVSTLPIGEEICIERRVSEIADSDRWSRVLQNPMSSYEFDLEVHGSPMSPAGLGKSSKVKADKKSNLKIM